MPGGLLFSWLASKLLTWPVKYVLVINRPEWGCGSPGRDGPDVCAMCAGIAEPVFYMVFL